MLRNADGGGRGGVNFSGTKALRRCVNFNVISATRGWVGVQFPGKKRYVTLEWPLMVEFLVITVLAKVVFIGRVVKKWSNKAMFVYMRPVCYKGPLKCYVTLLSGNWTPTHPLVTLITLNLTPS